MSINLSFFFFFVQKNQIYNSEKFQHKKKILICRNTRSLWRDKLVTTDNHTKIVKQTYSKITLIPIQEKFF